MALFISAVEFEHREILLRAKPPEMLAVSPKGTVPVVVLPNGDVLDESLDIMHWALAQNDPENWARRIDSGLIAANDGPFKSALDRYKYPARYGLDDPAGPRDSALGHLSTLDERLTQHDFLTGDDRGFTDIALFPFVRQFAQTDRTWFDALPLPALQQWLSGLLASPLFAAIMEKRPLWQTDPPNQT